MKRFDTAVRSITQVAQGYYELRFDWLSGEPPAPGSFLTVRAGGRYDPALRRPFAFSDYGQAPIRETPPVRGAAPARGAAPSPGSAAEAAFIFQLRGRGTEHLARLAPGDGLDVLGPLGRGFSKPPRGTRPILIAGGIGLGPMLYLAKALVADAAAGLCEAPILAMGFRSAAFVPSLALPEGAVVCTDDGSAGFRGTVGDWLALFDPGLPPAFYACGPGPMMAAVAAAAESRNAPYEAAVEQWMACGVGACAGCAVALKGGLFARACADGPVLDGRSVDWEAGR